ncbi:hypothetical protein NE237_030674 [Protea cynaroides]|uniref:NAC domain-containing protein n=1 Tax=Protea cynaroides TaxID=273540 RepID=A0A9Q0GTH1_9MAGN|nr:hypothetical protein NE237_030674 [Protea cynaroides]
MGDPNPKNEIDLYGYDPCDLLNIACFPYGRGGSRKHWYCFTAKASTERVKRKARGGFWKRKGRSRDIVAAKGGCVLGKRKTSVFYRGNSSRAMKTDWVFYEYTLIDNLKLVLVFLCFLIRNYVTRVEILSKSKLERCEKVSDKLNCTKKILVNMAVPSGTTLETVVYQFKQEGY